MPERAPARRVQRALVALLATLGGVGCISRSPRPEDFLAAGHRSPQDTLDTFRDALAADVPELEYRCLSDAFRRELGVSLLSYAEARDRLPFYRHAADAEVVSERRIDERRVEVTLCLDHAFGEEWFRVELTREDFWEVWSGDTLAWDDYARFDDLVRADERGVRVELPLDPSVVPADVTELRIAQGWKIDSFETIAPPNP